MEESRSSRYNITMLEQYTVDVENGLALLNEFNLDDPYDFDHAQGIELNADKISNLLRKFVSRKPEMVIEQYFDGVKDGIRAYGVSTDYESCNVFFYKTYEGKIVREVTTSGC